LSYFPHINSSIANIISQSSFGEGVADGEGDGDSPIFMACLTSLVKAPVCPPLVWNGNDGDKLGDELGEGEGDGLMDEL